MKEQLNSILNAAQDALAAAASIDELEAVRVKYLGKKGELTAVLRGMGRLGEDERRDVGALANDVRARLDEAIAQRRLKLDEAALASRLATEGLDVTLPGRARPTGRMHPLSIVLRDVTDIFCGMGFMVADGPEVELDYYNFEALNMPPNHPARDTQDTFYVSDRVLLRTQTSSVQIRVMEHTAPPIRIISPGRVYRSDEVDATHSPVFNQIEGLAVDRGITMADLKGTLAAFAERLYKGGVKVRFRPHHFPYTEPSAEMDVMCFQCQGAGCRMCKGEGYIEILGAGMVHPDVLRRCGIDPEVYSGFAFGVGLERIAMRRYNIDDIRLFYENDVRFLNQF